MKIRLGDFDSLEIELGNGRTLNLSTSRDGDLTRVRLDCGPDRPPIQLRYLTGRDEKPVHDGVTALITASKNTRDCIEMVRRRLDQTANELVIFLSELDVDLGEAEGDLRKGAGDA